MHYGQGKRIQCLPSHTSCKQLERHVPLTFCECLHDTNCHLSTCNEFALRICDVLLKDGNIKDEIRLSAEQTKGDRARTVVLSDRMQSEIRNYLCSRFKLNDLLAVTLTDTTRALFSNQKNPHRGFSASTACQMFHYWYQGANVEGSSHSGRRGFITNLANKGVSVHVLKELAGHLSIAVTEKYISKNPAMLRSAVELL